MTDTTQYDEWHDPDTAGVTYRAPAGVQLAWEGKPERADDAEFWQREQEAGAAEAAKTLPGLLLDFSATVPMVEVRCDGRGIAVTVGRTICFDNVAGLCEELGLADAEADAFWTRVWPAGSMDYDDTKGGLEDQIRAATKDTLAPLDCELTTPVERVLGARLRDAIAGLSPERQQAAVGSERFTTTRTDGEHLSVARIREMISDGQRQRAEAGERPVIDTAYDGDVYLALCGQPELEDREGAA